MTAYLQELVQANLALAGAGATASAIRPILLELFGAEISYSRWLIVPLAVAAVLFPAPTIERSSETAAHSTFWANEPIASSSDEAVTELALADSKTSGQRLSSTVSLAILAIWIIGAAGFAAALACRQKRFQDSLGLILPASDYGRDVYRSSSMSAGPCIMWRSRPVIVVPADFETRFSAVERELILLHERAHKECGDIYVKFAASVFFCLFWCNPAAHFALKQLRDDQELACDARVIRERPKDRAAYAQALLRALTQARGTPVVCSLNDRPSLKKRFAALASRSPSLRRRSAGVLATIGFSITGCCAAWAGQPARIVLGFPGLDRAAATRLSAGQANLGAADKSGVREIGIYETKRIVVRGSALIEVIPENRANIVVEASDGSLATAIDGDRLVIDAGVSLVRTSCGGAPRGRLVVIRTPQKVNLDVAADSFVHIAAIDDLGLRLEGCSSAVITGPVRDLSLIISNDGVFAMSDPIGDLSIIGEDRGQASIGDVEIDASIRAEGASSLSFGNVRERNIGADEAARVYFRPAQPAEETRSERRGQSMLAFG